MTLNFAIAILAAYLVGSVSSAIIICKFFRMPDPRTSGSSNPGATNVLRLGGRLPASLTLMSDILKGFVPVCVASQWLGSWGLGFIALAAFVGHLYPVFFKFKGGKGVATFIGAIFALNWLLGVSFCTVWLLVAISTRYSSLAALVASVCLPFVAYSFQPRLDVVAVSLMVAFILLRHKVNIQRLLSGTESKIGQSA